MAQRSLNFSNPILVFSEAGKLLRSWGAATVRNDSSVVRGSGVVMVNCRLTKIEDMRCRP